MTEPADRAAAIALERFAIGRWHVTYATGEVWWDAGMRRIAGRDTPLSTEAWVEQVVHPGDRARLSARLAEVFRGGPFSMPPSRVVRPNGEVRWVRAEGTVQLDPEGQPLSAAGAMMDVTEEVQLRERLTEAERMETIGQLASGISHNFNNMLMIVDLLLHEVRDQIDDVPGVPDKARTDLEGALAATQRAAHVVRQLATLSRAETQPTLVEDVGASCQALAELVRRGLPSNVALRVTVESTRRVRSFAGALAQILQNLIHNARDALVDHDGIDKRITVEVRDTRQFDADWVEIVVADNGPGIPEALEATLFEPFVTTKGAGGTGLGLASSASLAERLGGHLGYRPAAAGGAEFLLVLPALPDDALVTAPPREGGEGTVPPFGRGRVLLIDDEAVLLRTVHGALTRAGFEVVSAARVADVVGHLEGGFRPQVVLLDRSVDRAGGEVLLGQLRMQVPEARVLLFTGESVDPALAGRVEGVVQKPVSMRAIVEAVDEALRR